MVFKPITTETAAFVAFAFFNSFFAQEGLLPLASLLAASLVGAVGLIRIGRLIAGRA